MNTQPSKIRSHNKLRWTLDPSRTAFKRYMVLFLFIFVFATPLFEAGLKALFAVAAFAIVFFKRPSLSKREANWILLVLILFAPSIIIDCFFLTQYNSLSITGFFIIFITILSILIANRIDDSSTILAYANLVTTLTLVSTVSFLIVQASPSILSFAFPYEYYGFAGLSLGFQNFVIADGIVVYRNAGFASEPGIFQIYINISAAIFFYLKRMNLFRFLILAAGIITANSTAGLLTFAAIVVFASDARYRLLAALLALVLSSQVFTLALTHYESKFLSDYAFLGRFEPIANALDIVKQHPLGFGSVRYDHFFEALHIGSHDGYTQTLMRFGIFGFLFFIGSLFVLAKRQRGIALAISIGSMTNYLLPIPAIVFLLFVDWKRLQATAELKSPNTPTYINRL